MNKKKTNKKKTSKRKTNKRKTSKRKTNKRKTIRRKTNKRKTNKRKTNIRKTSKRKTNKRKTSKRKPSKRRLRRSSEIITKINIAKPMKITRNQMMAFRALQKQGSKLIFDKDWDSKIDKDRTLEYSGFIDFDDDGLEKYIIDAKAEALDEEIDNVVNFPIYTPRNFLFNEDYEYNFHTHPGGRKSHLFEPVHLGDIRVYVENALDKGITQGELVFALEGIYIISPLKNIKNIKYPEDRLDILDDKLFSKVNNNYMNKFNKQKKYDRKNFIYNVVAQNLNKDFIKPLNQIYNPFGINIIFHPVIFNKKYNHWEYPSIELPVKVIEIFNKKMMIN